MALLVTILLMLISFATDVAANSPSFNAVSALDLWMLSMNILTLLEYITHSILLYAFSVYCDCISRPL